jgi:hypothetical protein
MLLFHNGQRGKTEEKNFKYFQRFMINDYHSFKDEIKFKYFTASHSRHAFPTECQKLKIVENPEE